MADDQEERDEDQPDEDENGGEDVERMDAPNQQAVGQPHPSVEGTGGQAAEPETSVEEQDEPRAEEKPRRGPGRPRKNV